jgi:hypothetical protein
MDCPEAPKEAGCPPSRAGPLLTVTPWSFRPWGVFACHLSAGINCPSEGQSALETGSFDTG